MVEKNSLCYLFSGIVLNAYCSFCLIFNGLGEGEIVEGYTGNFRNPQLSDCSRMQIMQSHPMNIKKYYFVWLSICGECVSLCFHHVGLILTS